VPVTKNPRRFLSYGNEKGGLQPRGFLSRGDFDLPCNASQRMIKKVTCHMWYYSQVEFEVFTWNFHKIELIPILLIDFRAMLLHRLKFLKINFDHSSQRRVAVVKPTVNKRMYKRMKSLSSQGALDASEFNCPHSLYL